MISVEYFIDVFKYHNKPEYTRTEIEFAIKSASEYIDLIVTSGKMRQDQELTFGDDDLISSENSQKLKDIQNAICRTTLFCLDNGFDFLSGSSQASAGDFSISDNIDFAVSMKNLDNYLYAIFSKYYDLNILKHQDIDVPTSARDAYKSLTIDGSARDYINPQELRKMINEWGVHNIKAETPLVIERTNPQDNNSTISLKIKLGDFEITKQLKDLQHFLNDKLKNKRDINDSYSQKEIDDKIREHKPDLSQFYNKKKMDEFLNKKADANDVISPKDLKENLAKYWDKTMVMTKDEVRGHLDSKADKRDTFTKKEISKLIHEIKPDFEDVYSVLEINELLKKYVEGKVFDKLDQEVKTKLGVKDFQEFKDKNQKALDEKLEVNAVQEIRHELIRLLYHELNNIDFENLEVFKEFHKDIDQKVNIIDYLEHNNKLDAIIDTKIDKTAFNELRKHYEDTIAEVLRDLDDKISEQTLTDNIEKVNKRIDENVKEFNIKFDQELEVIGELQNDIDQKVSAKDFLSHNEKINALIDTKIDKTAFNKFKDDQIESIGELVNDLDKKVDGIDFETFKNENDAIRKAFDNKISKELDEKVNNKDFITSTNEAKHLINELDEKTDKHIGDFTSFVISNKQEIDKKTNEKDFQDFKDKNTKALDTKLDKSKFNDFEIDNTKKLNDLTSDLATKLKIQTFNEFKDSNSKTIKDLKDKTEKELNDFKDLTNQELDKKLDKKTFVDEIVKKTNVTEFNQKVNDLTANINKKLSKDDFNTFKDTNTKELNKKVNNQDFNENTTKLNDLINTKRNISDSYSNNEVDELLKHKATTSELQDFKNKTADNLNKKTDLSIFEIEIKKKDKEVERIDQALGEKETKENANKKYELFNDLLKEKASEKKVQDLEIELGKKVGVVEFREKINQKLSITKANELFDYKVNKTDYKNDKEKLEEKINDKVSRNSFNNEVSRIDNSIDNSKYFWINKERKWSWGYPLNMDGQTITGLSAPNNDRDAATKMYVDGRFANVSKTHFDGEKWIRGKAMFMSNQYIEGLRDPTADTDAANKYYVDRKISFMFEQLGFKKEQVQQAMEAFDIEYKATRKKDNGKNN